MTRIDRLPFLLAIAALAAVPAMPVAAAEGDVRLPGVEGDYRIVKELPPEPEPDSLQTPNGPGTYRIGDWDVTISGSVSFEIGTGMNENLGRR